MDYNFYKNNLIIPRLKAEFLVFTLNVLKLY